MWRYCPKTDPLLSVPFPAPLPVGSTLAFPEEANPTSSSSMGDFHHLQLPTSVLTENTLEKGPQGNREDTCRSVTEMLLKYPISLGLVSAYRVKNTTHNYLCCLIVSSPPACASQVFSNSYPDMEQGGTDEGLLLGSKVDEPSGFWGREVSAAWAPLCHAACLWGW